MILEGYSPWDHKQSDNWVTNTYLSFKQQKQHYNIVVRQQLHARHCFSTQINFQKQCTTYFLKTEALSAIYHKLNTLMFIYTKSHPYHNYIFIILEWFKHPAKIGLLDSTLEQTWNAGKAVINLFQGFWFWIPCWTSLLRLIFILSWIHSIHSYI